MRNIRLLGSIYNKINNYNMEQISYSVGELKRIIRESATEFEPKLGDNVMSDNKKNNDKSYNDAEKAAKDFDGGLNPRAKGKLPDKEDGNRTTLEYTSRTEPSKEYKEKVEAQLQGYTSKLEKNNKIAKAAEFDNDGQIAKQIKDASNKMEKEKKELETSGLQGSKLNKKDKNTLYENMKPMAKRLNFKHTRFLNESQMLSRIPEEYKRDGQVIYMKDANDNEYIVECVKSENTGFIETNVISYNNEKVMNEQVNRIQELFDYKTPNTYAPSSMKTRVDESKGFEDIMNLSRGLIK